MKYSKHSKESFMNDINGTKFELASENLLFKNLVFSNENGSDNWFEVLTWDYHLTICSNKGEYTFTGAKDMFELFRDKESKEPNLAFYSENIYVEYNIGTTHSFNIYKYYDNVKSWLLNVVDFDFTLSPIGLENIIEKTYPSLFNVKNKDEAHDAIKNFPSKDINFEGFWNISSEYYT